MRALKSHVYTVLLCSRNSTQLLTFSGGNIYIYSDTPDLYIAFFICHL